MAVLTVLHPAVQPYFDEMLASLHAQEDRDFVLYTVVERVDHSWILDRASIDLVLVPGGATPAENRHLGVEAVRADGVSSIVFLDADDLAAPNRTAVCREFLESHPVVFNELIPFGGMSSEPLLSPRFAEGDEIGWADVIDGNCLGLSNTAARTDVLASGEQWSTLDGAVVDWLLFTRTLFGGCRAAFTQRTHTRYRQHAGNTRGAERLTCEGLLRAVDVKAQHYQSLASLHPTLRDRAEWFIDARRRLHEDPQFKSDYFAHCRAHLPVTPLWWEVAAYHPADPRLQ